MNTLQITIEDRIQKLPNDIIRYIIPYTYSIQPKCLLDDISSFYRTNELNKKLYSQLYHAFLLEMDEPMEQDELWYKETWCTEWCKEWWVNDIYNFINNRDDLSWYLFFTRNPFLNSRPKIDRFYHFIRNHDSLYFQIRVCWGFFLPEERDQFVSFLSDALITKM